MENSCQSNAFSLEFTGRHPVSVT